MTDDLRSVIKDKWNSGINAEGLTKLTAISGEVNELYLDSRRHLTKNAIGIGKALMIARELFAGDRQYGIWCAEQFPWGKRGTLYNLRRLAEQAGTARLTAPLLDKLSVSALFELLPASQEAIEAVAERVEAGDVPTVAGIREIRSGGRAGESAPAIDGEASGRPRTGIEGPTRPPTPPPSGGATESLPDEKQSARKPPVASPVEQTFHQWQLIINRPVHQRVQYYVDGALTIEKAYVMFGLDPNPCCYPSPFTVDTLWEKFNKLGGWDKNELEYLQEALKLIEEDRTGFHA